MTGRFRSNVSEEAILDMLNRGDDEGLVLLYRHCRGAVTSYVLRNSGTPDDADDMLQEALIALWERVRAGRYTREAKLETFIVAVVKNIWHRRLLRKRREPVQTTDPDSMPDGEPGVLEELLHDEQAAAVQRALESMGEPCRTLLLLYYYDELAMEEIAKRMGFANAATAKSKKYQCKKQLQQRVGVIEEAKT